MFVTIISRAHTYINLGNSYLKIGYIHTMIGVMCTLSKKCMNTFIYMFLLKGHTTNVMHI